MQLVLVTDGRGDLGRIERVVASAIAGGCRCVQLREPQWSARLMEDACARLSPTSSSVGGALLALELAGGLERVLPVLDRLQVIARGASFGGVETLATVPAYTTHATLTPEQLAAVGISPGLIRVAVGLEPAEVLLEDLRQAVVS